MKADLIRLPPAAKAYIHELETRAAADAKRIAERDARIDELTKRLDALEEQYRLALARQYAPKSEKRRDRVFNEAEEAADAEPADEDSDVATLPDTGLPELNKPAPKKRGRKPLPADLPRERIEYDLPEDQKICPCCGKGMHLMGEEVSEQLHMEVKVSVLQHARAKYACRHCERHGVRTPIVVASMPAQPLPGSYASPSMIATVTAGKYVDGTPLYRMEDVLARSNIAVSRGTLANWIIRPAELHYTRIYEALKQILRSQWLIHGDETTVQALKEQGRNAQDKSYMWVYRSAADSEQPVVLFEYQQGRGGEHPRAFLGDYAGVLMSDGWAAWRTVKTAKHLGCLAHARRLFTDALKGQKNKPSPRITRALEFFQALYQVEALAKQAVPESETLTDCRYRLRQQHSVPLLNAFKAWLDELAPKVLPQSLLGEAIGYCRRQWQYLIRYVDDGRLPIDNNVIERDIRPFATARKSWLYSDTEAGAKASAIVYSMMLTCRACDVEPRAWLLHVLTELPQRAPDADISDLLPFNYAKRQAEASVS
ncbi:IS66 family transposase [Burkholderia oklahomensis]|uniref:IS66 family transposase n=1 Tax=Burkholderia oklahomensis TaxID=342113 RepID=UPI00016A6E6D|nr:IS66 family transposase [Burkholderia oklahomensis]AJX32166.1 zinc-finger binding domain of transposase IS66 family protein [Burkholderia oklahomensis C6786]AOI46293.1 transposase [Burkholderia oklahomensis C6786]KUY53948.1 transposase [Burkholderia oklahomensis C6786]MBI0361117.1 IS66 family transposase [Burkholderia oklahomensis]SUW54764.1 Transposase and inactivated derivatives [Burkholderia oklahomensis]